MDCRVCGVKNADVAEKCRQCNALLRRPEAQPPPSQLRQILDRVPSTLRSPLVLVGIAVGVLILAMVVSLVLRRGPGTEQVSAAAPSPPRASTLEQQLAADLQELELRQARENEEAQLDALYTPPTFSTREAVQQWSFAVQQAEERDASHAREWQQLRSALAQRVDKSDRPADQKVLLAKKVDAALAEAEALQKKARAAAKQWAHATLDLYDYAGTNAEHIDARGTEVRIRHYEVASGFNGRLAQARKLQQEMQKLSAKVIETRHARLEEAGVALPQ